MFNHYTGMKEYWIELGQARVLGRAGRSGYVTGDATGYSTGCGEC
jgi:hypothetical protein